MVLWLWLWGCLEVDLPSRISLLHLHAFWFRRWLLIRAQSHTQLKFKKTTSVRFGNSLMFVTDFQDHDSCRTRFWRKQKGEKYGNGCPSSRQFPVNDGWFLLTFSYSDLALGGAESSNQFSLLLETDPKCFSHHMATYSLLFFFFLSRLFSFIRSGKKADHTAHEKIPSSTCQMQLQLLVA